MRRSRSCSEARATRWPVVALLVVAAGAFLARSEPAPAGGIAVVVGKANGVERVSLDVLRELYLRRQRLWPNGTRAAPVNLPPDHPLRDRFSLRVLGRRTGDLVGYWRRMYFDGILPPLVLQTPAAVCAYVGTEPGAVGYVAPDDVDPSSCRVLTILPDAPD